METVPWRAFLAEAETRLERAGIEGVAVDARRIVEEAAGLESTEFASALDAAATEKAVARFDSMLARREAGEPLQYVVGSWGFRSLDLLVDSRVLIPRPETEAVAGWAIAAAKARSSTREVIVADLGTGSGAIALAVAVECLTARVFATDISADALAVARANLAGLGRAAGRVSLHEGDWFGALPAALEASIDVLVSNPPYVSDGEPLPPVVDEWEPHVALRAGPEGLDAVCLIVDDAARWLASSGVLVIEMAPHHTEPMAERASRAGLTDVRIEVDLQGRKRALVAMKP